MGDDGFSRCHPLLNFFYFAVVLGFTMFVQHPVFLALSFLGPRLMPYGSPDLPEP